ncbi:hypothetical protein ACJX0J_027663, partial [Zea mays]
YISLYICINEHKCLNLSPYHFNPSLCQNYQIQHLDVALEEKKGLITKIWVDCLFVGAVEGGNIAGQFDVLKCLCAAFSSLEIGNKNHPPTFILLPTMAQESNQKQQRRKILAAFTGLMLFPYKPIWDFIQTVFIIHK